MKGRAVVIRLYEANDTKFCAKRTKGSLYAFDRFMAWIPAARHVVAQLTLRNSCDSFETGKRKTFAVIRQEGGNIVTEIKIQIFKSFPVCFVFINLILKMNGVIN